MPTLTIRPTMIDYGLHRAEYASLLDALGQEGHDVVFDDPDERTEYRSVPDAFDVIVTAGQAVADVAVFVDAHWQEGAALAGLVELLRRKLRRKPGTTVRPGVAIIYGPRGEVLKRVELADDEAD